MTKERPVLFSGAMVRAILDGRKTQTRRVAKPVKHPDLGNVQAPGAFVLEHEPQHVIDRACPYGEPGHRLWVRETWRPRIVHSCFDMGCDCETVWVDYPAGGEGKEFYGVDIPDEWCMPQAAIKGRPVPSLHMPRWASRILLEITGVRVERLYDCSEADAAAEGAAPVCTGSSPCIDTDNARNYGDRPTALSAFQSLWESINGAGAWEQNPWVWVVEFRRISA